ncbi:MAG: efflux RND transporter periplasmic adaptor subunit [Flavobacteriales bacterium]|nr:efflux RND transporter periplasmic adaptor subunit [Flavobacteriales bacterium]
MNWIAGAFVLPAIVLLASCGDSGEAKDATGPKPTMKVDGFIATPQPFNNTVAVTAALQANEQVELMAPMSGQVMDIFFNEGEKVAEGQAIIRMDDRSWKAQLLGLNAELDAATKDLDRKKALLSIEGSTQEEIDGLVSKVETLRAQIQQLQVNVDLANVKAPFAGTLGLRNFSKGAYLKEGEVITVVTQLDRLKVDFSIAQEHRNSLKVGKVVRVVVANDTLEASIYAINPLVDASSRTISVRAMLKQSGQNTVMPGTFAEVLVATEFVEDALMVPTQAIVPEINDQTVFLYKNGKVERKTVQLGGRNADMVHVASGISKGDTLITTGLLQVKVGMDVTLQSIIK